MSPGKYVTRKNYLKKKHKIAGWFNTMIKNSRQAKFEKAVFMVVL